MLPSPATLSILLRGSQTRGHFRGSPGATAFLRGVRCVGAVRYEQNVTAARLEFHPKLEVSRAKTASESRRELYTDLPLRSEEEEEHFCQILSWLLSHKVKSCR